jgi:S-adenosylmethionine-dependent methyltransferase
MKASAGGGAITPSGDGSVAPGGSGPFAPAVRRWLDNLGRLRDAVRQEVLASQLAGLPQLSNGPARVLDVGCGQGTQALHLARAGHEVTGLDPSAEMLASFEAAVAAEPEAVAGRLRLIRGGGEEALQLAPGPYDLVMCHGVLMYLGDAAPLLAALTAVVAADGALSLLVRNGLAPAMRDGLLGNWQAALRAFDSKEYVNRLGIAARAHAPGDVDLLLAPLGWRRRAWFGVRVFTDHKDEPAPGPDGLDEMLRAEREAGRRDPYRSVAALLHLVYERDAAGERAAPPETAAAPNAAGSAGR